MVISSFSINHENEVESLMPRPKDCRTRRTRRAASHLWTLAILISLAACVNTIEHNQERAAKKAREFVEVAFVRGNAEVAYTLLAPATKRYVSPEQFKHVLARLHPQQTPKSVSATEFEPMKGETAIFIYLSGENSGEHFNYRITMEGTASTDYRVLKFERSQEPYTHSSDMKRFGE